MTDKPIDVMSMLKAALSAPPRPAMSHTDFLQAQLESFLQDREYVEADITEAIERRDSLDKRIAEVRRKLEQPECSICRNRHGMEVLHECE